jgi:hypothetical protein
VVDANDKIVIYLNFMPTSVPPGGKKLYKVKKNQRKKGDGELHPACI